MYFFQIRLSESKSNCRGKIFNLISLLPRILVNPERDLGKYELTWCVFRYKVQKL